MISIGGRYFRTGERRGVAMVEHPCYNSSAASALAYGNARPRRRGMYAAIGELSGPTG
jgi:hypothetical protein